MANDAIETLRAALERADRAVERYPDDAYVILRDAVRAAVENERVVEEQGFLMLPSSGFRRPAVGRVLFKRPGWSRSDRVVATRRRVEVIGDWEYSVDPATLPGDVRYGPRGIVPS